MAEFSQSLQSKDVFDILGISNKEDCFTNLIAEAFNIREHSRFRKKVCNFLTNERFTISNTEDCEIYTRNVFYIEKQDETGNRTKVLPDMLIISPSQKSVAVIENKIFSDEGYKQTAAYSSTSFQEKLAIKLEDAHDIKGDFNVEYYFMTLHGDDAASDNFRSIKWTDFILETYDNSQLLSPFDILMADINSRAKELKSFIDLPIVPEKCFKEYYSRRSRWIDSKAVVSKFFEPILNEIDRRYNGEVEYIISQPKSRVPQMLIQFSLPHWKSNSLDDYTKDELVEKFEHTRNIHVEFNWPVGSYNATLLLHYETNPYYSEKELNIRFPEIKSGYFEHREKFKVIFQKFISDTEARIGKGNWVTCNTKLALAKATCNGFTDRPFNEVKDWFVNAFDVAYVSVNRTLEFEE